MNTSIRVESNSDGLGLILIMKIRARKKTSGPIFGGQILKMRQQKELAEQILKMRQQKEQAEQEGLALLDENVSQ